jgi:hypothetical protein
LVSDSYGTGFGESRSVKLPALDFILNICRTARRRNIILRYPIHGNREPIIRRIVKNQEGGVQV